MTNCDLNAVLSCLPIVGPLVNIPCVLDIAEQIVEKIKKIDPQGVIRKANMTEQELRQFERLKSQFQKECVPLLRKNRIYSICGIVGSTLTVPTITAAGPFLSVVALSGCMAITLAHTANLYATNRALTVLTSNQQIAGPLQ